MAMFIDAQKLIRRLSAVCVTDDSFGVGMQMGLDHAMKIIGEIPFTDVAEVVHGYWLFYSTTMQECSICNRHTPRHKYKYCPHCGAVMEDRWYE